MNHLVARIFATVFLAFPVSGGCASMTSASDVPSTLVTDLSAVFENPLAYEGRLFQGYVYVRSAAVLEFYPRPVRTDADIDSLGAVLLIGDGAEKEQAWHGLYGIDPEQRILIRGRLSPQRECFIDHLCAPWAHPILIEEFQLVRG